MTKMEGDIEKSVGLLKEIQSSCTDIVNHVNNLCKKAESGDFSTSKGISFLEVKYQMLLTYLVNLTYVMLKKCRGESIKGDPAIERLVEVRTSISQPEPRNLNQPAPPVDIKQCDVLEKMRPIDQKLKYQIDKVIRIATTGGKDSKDPMRFKPNPDSLESKLEDESSDSGSDSEDDGDKEKKTSKIYRPPKMAAASFDEETKVEKLNKQMEMAKLRALNSDIMWELYEETKVEKLNKQMEMAKRRALNSDIMRDLKAQYDEGPEEIRETRDIYRMKEDRKRKERTEFEEENFIRLQLTKKDKHEERRMATTSSLANLTQFGNISALMDEGGEAEFGAKRRKTGGGGKSGKKGKGKKGKKGSKKKKFH